jgi:hypothetical protein
MKTSAESRQRQDEVSGGAPERRRRSASADAPYAAMVASSPRMVAQRRKIQAAFGSAIQRSDGHEGEESQQGPAAALQRRSTSPPVVQRKIYHEGNWYGLNEENDLRQVVQSQQLPEFKTGWLQLDDTVFMLNSDRTAWVQDALLDFKGLGRGLDGKDSRKRTGASLPDPLADVGFEEGQAKPRIGPKHLDRQVTKITIFKGRADSAHWSLQCEVTGGKKIKHMKVDLIAAGYRILYGAKEDSKETVEEIEFTPKNEQALLSVERVYRLFVEIAKEKGAWTGNKTYNCQDFALEMLSRLNVNEGERLGEQENLRQEIKNR